MSPILFIVCMDSVNKMLYLNFPLNEISIKKDEGFNTNRLLFINDIKLMAEEEEVREDIINQAAKFCSHVNLKITPPPPKKKSLLPMQNQFILKFFNYNKNIHTNVSALQRL